MIYEKHGSIYECMKTESSFFGKDGYYWWVGVVEDRTDPLKLGRLRVRVLGCHTEDKTLIPTCQLHWAYVYQPITFNQGMNGLGHSPTGPAEGTWVHGFFKDNGSAQDPVILSVIAGIPQEAPIPTIGFYDPSLPFHDLLNGPRKIRRRYYPNDGTGAQNLNETTASLYPRATHPWGCIIGESDVNRLARAENVGDTIIGVRQRQRDVCIPIAFAHTAPTRRWNEPLPGYNAAYPYNHVYESESGHIVEIDDTPNAERIHIWHRSGTHIELGTGQEDNPGLNGDFALKVVGKRFEVTMQNSYSHYQNTMNVTVDGETNIYCRSNCNVQVDGDLNVHVGGNYNEKVHGNYTTDIDGDRTVRIGGKDSLSVEGTRNVGVGGTLTESSGGHFSMTSGVEISGDAPQIHWNSGHSATAPVDPPQVPPFPPPLDVWTEGRNECGPNPICECKPDTNPAVNPDTSCGPVPNLPPPVPCPDPCAGF